MATNQPTEGLSGLSVPSSMDAAAATRCLPSHRCIIERADGKRMGGMEGGGRELGRLKGKPWEGKPGGEEGRERMEEDGWKIWERMVETKKDKQTEREAEIQKRLIRKKRKNTT